MRVGFSSGIGERPAVAEPASLKATFPLALRVFLLALTAAVALLIQTPSGASATALPSTITENMTLSAAGSPYTGTSTIQTGVTVKVEPGVKLTIMKLTVKGTLQAEGTAAEPIVFTSSTKEPKAGNWQNIVFEPGSGASVIDYGEIAYAGLPVNSGAIEVKGSSPRITNSTIRNGAYYGIKVFAGGPNIGWNKISNNSGIGAYFSSEAEKTLDINFHDNLIEGNGSSAAVYVEPSPGATFATSLGHNTLTKNGAAQAIHFNGGPKDREIPSDIGTNTAFGNTGGANADHIVFGGVLTKSATWEASASTPLYPTGGLKIQSGTTLTLKAGVSLYLGSIEVFGTLRAEGSPKEPVTFQATTEAGIWGGIFFRPGSGASLLDHVDIRKGGSSTSQAIKIEDSSPIITDSTISGSPNYSIYTVGQSAPEIAHNVISGGRLTYFASSTGKTLEINFHNNVIEKAWGSAAVYVEPSPGPVIGTSLGENLVAGNSATQAIYYNGGSKEREVPPDIDSNLVFGNTGGASTNQVAFGGVLNKSATWTPSITPLHLESLFTVGASATLKLESGIAIHGGAMKVQGTLRAEGTQAEPVVFKPRTSSGNCGSIKLEPGSGGSLLNYLEVSDCKAGSNSGAVEIRAASPQITRSALRSNGGYAIKVTESGSPKIEWNRFRGNSAGLSYTGTGKLAAPNNDWGCSSGPQPAGCGDSVTGNVDWKPAAPTPEKDGNCNGDDTDCPTGADPVSLATGQLSYSHRDLLLTNVSDLPLELSRAYNSGSSFDSGFGPGWSQTGLATATELNSGDALVVRQDGRQDLFLKTESGYQAPPGVTGVLRQVEGSFQLTSLDRAVFRFDASGRIATITDDHGLKTTYGYDVNGRLATITDPSAQTLTFSYNASNHIASVKDSTGREVKYGYSAAGDLDSVADALGGVTKYGYDPSHRITSITDPRGSVILKNVYDSQGRIVEQRDGLEHLWKLSYASGETVVSEPEGGKLKYGFDSQSRVVSETDQLGHTTSTGYDAAGNVDEVVKPGGAKWTFGHDAAGNVTSAKDPEGGERKFEYDSNNRLVHVTDAGGGSWGYEWSAAGDLTKLTDPEGAETTYTYNATGQPLTRTDPNKHKSEFSWDARGNQLSATDPLGHKTSFEPNARNYLVSKTLPGLKAEAFERNALGDLLARTTPEGHKTKYVYDANGLPTQVTDPAEGVWKIERDAMERPTAYIDPLGQETKVTYNGNLRPVKVVNRRGKETSYAYDLANQLTEVKRPEGEIWHYGYDDRGNRTSTLDPRSNETTYGYDLLDRMTEADEPLSVSTEYGYDSNGDLISVKDPRGNTTSYGYDKLGRLNEIAQPLEKKTTFTYDPAGSQLTKTTPVGILGYSYDAADRLTKVRSGESTLRSYGYDTADRRTSATDAEGHKIEIAYTEEGRPSSINDGRGQSLTRSYDSRGNLLKQVDGRGTLEYGYDKLSRMTALTDPQGKALGFAYDPESDLTEVTRPNGVTTTNIYDDTDRLSETISKSAEPLNVLESLKYTYDTAGNVTGRTDQRLETSTSYSYDALNRLIEFNPPGEGATSYGYDAAGNRTEAGGTAFTFNALNQPSESSTGTTYSYDDAGRLTEEVDGSEETIFSWDPFDHLAKVEGPAGNVTYSFDGLERLSESNDGEAPEVSHYGDLGDMPTLKTESEGEAIVSYVQGPRGLMEQRTGEETSFALVDSRSDVTAITTAGGEVQSRQDFDPWGQQLSGPNLEMGFLGAWERPSDPTTGLIHMGARSYDPSLGSFVTEDPVLGHLGVGVSLNRYPYAWDNPVNRYDLDGRDVCVFGGCVGPDDVAEIGEDIEEGLDIAEEGASSVGSAVGSAADDGWDWTAPGREWSSDRAQDFWKRHGEDVRNIYNFVGAHWQTCAQGGAAGALGGATVGAIGGPGGSAAGGVAGGIGGCAGTVGVEMLLE